MRDKYLRKLNVELVDGDFPNPLHGQLRDPSQVHEIFSSLKDKTQETLLGVYLKDDLEAVAYEVLSIGGEDVSLVVPREVFKWGFLAHAYSFVLVHNHPSGDPTPSSQDREVMQMLGEKARALDFRFIDFMIVGDGSYWSMFEEGEGTDYSLVGSYHRE